MRKVMGALLLLSFATLPAIAHQVSKQKKAKGPAMEVVPEEHDFGTVAQDLKLVKEFEIRNIGTEVLEIGRISTSCGCTAALTSEKVLEPGETTTLKVTLETRKYEGQIQRSVSIASNDPKRIETIKVKAFVQQPEDSSRR